MNSPSSHHPSEAELMRFLDGELSPRQSRALRSHTGSCWQCRRDLNEMQTTIDAYLRLRASLPCPPPPREWAPLPFPAIEAPRRAWPLWKVALGAGVVFAGVIYLRPAAPVVDRPPIPATVAPVQAPAPPPPRPAPKQAPKEEVVVPLVSLELKILAGLHRVGADLGEDVEVILEKDGILVRAMALDPARVPVIREAVDGARLELVEPKAVIDESDAIVTRAHALSRLAARFQTVTLSNVDANLLQDIENSHRTALRIHVRQLQKLLSALELPEAAGEDIRPTADLARDLDQLISAGFAGARSPLSDAEIVERLQRVLRGLAR